MDIHERVGLNVRNARLAAGLSQLDLVDRLKFGAEDHGISQPYLSELENGRKNPTLATLWAISRALSVPLAGLVAEPAPTQKGSSSTSVGAEIGADEEVDTISTGRT